ncbi:uncharacterized protein LOC106179624 [Lingula anatina]|uniref:Uncharacterized protein LOC106179624 n=1 Tax=Lingula anatina TaxID=7574 RepID=A0A1S3K8H2_LINAN|nr:uncharacterized protein LOC106179624 [Lingula anatina]|eukprot:XP_013418797.1 uncharacterized protein LOC106179624 [Lingula anatina]
MASEAVGSDRFSLEQTQLAIQTVEGGKGSPHTSQNTEELDFKWSASCIKWILYISAAGSTHRRRTTTDGSGLIGPLVGKRSFFTQQEGFCIIDNGSNGLMFFHTEGLVVGISGDEDQ